MNDIEDKPRGMLVGLAIGDAVGTTNEFRLVGIADKLMKLHEGHD